MTIVAAKTHHTAYSRANTVSGTLISAEEPEHCFTHSLSSNIVFFVSSP